MRQAQLMIQKTKESIMQMNHDYSQWQLKTIACAVVFGVLFAFGMALGLLINFVFVSNEQTALLVGRICAGTFFAITIFLWWVILSAKKDETL